MFIKKVQRLLAPDSSDAGGDSHDPIPNAKAEDSRGSIDTMNRIKDVSTDEVPFGASLETALGNSNLDDASVKPLRKAKKDGDVITNPPVTPPATTTTAAADDDTVKPIDSAISKAAKDIASKIVKGGETVTPPAEADPAALTKEEIVAEENLNKKSTPEQRAAFQTMTSALKKEREKIRQLQTENDEIKKKLTALPTPAAPEAINQEYESLKQTHAKVVEERESYLKELAKVNIQATPEFKQTVETPLAEAQGYLNTLATEAGLSPSDLNRVAGIEDPAERRKAFKEAIAGISSIDAVDIKTEFEKVVTLAAKKKDILSNSDKELKALEDLKLQNKINTDINFSKEADKAYEETWPEFLKEYPFLQPDAASPEWNSFIDGIKVQAKQLDTHPLSNNQRAMLTYRAMAVTPMIALFEHHVKDTASQIADLEKSLAEFRGVSPNAGSGRAPAADGASAVDDDVDFLSAIGTR